MRDHLYVIKEDANALKAGAEARDMDVDSYTIYLDKAMLRKSFKAAAKELTDEREDIYDDDDDMDQEDIEITWQELEEDPALMLTCDAALKEGATYMDMNASEYKAYIKNMIKENEAQEETEEQNIQGTQSAAADEADMELAFKNAMEAAAKELGTDTMTLADNMLWMKEKDAMDAAVRTSGLNEEMLTGMINESLATAALNEDYSVDFDMETYLWLNIGCCLLILAFSAIGFFASCLFNRSKNAMAIGGGLPFASFIISIIVEMSENLENLKYITLTTLFDTQEILVLGDFGVGLAVLAGIAAVLYAAGCVIFTQKDLPL